MGNELQHFRLLRLAQSFYQGVNHGPDGMMVVKLVSELHLADF